MRVLFDHGLPFLLAHGGFQVQIEETRKGLLAAGVDAQFLPWWDEHKPVDLINYFGPPHTAYIGVAKQKGIPVIATTLHGGPSNRPRWRLRLQGWIVQSILRFPLGNSVKLQLPWTSYRKVAHNIVCLESERWLLKTVYRVPHEQISLVELGQAPEFLQAKPVARGDGPLVCVGTITPQKNSVPLARLTREAKVPVLFVGRPFAEDDYWREFASLVDGVNVLHQPFLSDRQALVRLLDSCRGAMIVSEFETWSCASHEAAARGLPLLLRPQRWAKERFGKEARYFDTWGTSDAAKTLRTFYEESPRLPSPGIRLYSWPEIGEQTKAIYERVLSNWR
jgi:hypothetical protein